MNIIKLLMFVILIGHNTNAVFGQNKHKKKTEKFDTINMQTQSGSYNMQLSFLKGESHNHPTFVIWLEDLDGNIIETLFVTQYYATGTFGHADAGSGRWDINPGEAIRPAALPYWSHKSNIINRDSVYAPTPENPLPDAISGATPKGSFVLNTNTGKKLPNQFKIRMEINQTWDWNDYWTNNKYPNDKDYKTSAQPSVIYETIIDLNEPNTIRNLTAIGHGHYSGKDGLLYEDLSTLSTALNIVKQIQVILPNQN